MVYRADSLGMALLGALNGDLPSPAIVLKLVVAGPLLLLTIYFLYNEFIRYRTRIKNLPGPQGWPIVGNLFQVRLFSVSSFLFFEVGSHKLSLLLTAAAPR